eukprot:880566-Rhodomonas_salina.2
MRCSTFQERDRLPQRPPGPARTRHPLPAPAGRGARAPGTFGSLQPPTRAALIPDSSRRRSKRAALTR